MYFSIYKENKTMTRMLSKIVLEKIIVILLVIVLYMFIILNLF